MNRTTDHILVEMKGVFCKLIIICKLTNQTYKFPVLTFDWFKYTKFDSEYLLQDCFPYLSIKYRELIKSGQYIDPR